MTALLHVLASFSILVIGGHKRGSRQATLFTSQFQAQLAPLMSRKSLRRCPPVKPPEDHEGRPRRCGNGKYLRSDAVGSLLFCGEVERVIATGGHSQPRPTSLCPFPSSPRLPNKIKGIVQGNLLRDTPSNKRTKNQTQTSIHHDTLEFCNVDYASSNATSSHFRATLHIFKDSEAVIGMITKARKSDKETSPEATELLLAV